MEMKAKFLIVVLGGLLSWSSISAQTSYPFMPPQQALELATADPSSLSEKEFLDFNVAVLNLINLPDVEMYVGKMYNYYHGEVQFTAFLTRCRGKKIIPYLQLMLKQVEPICPWGAKKYASRRYACYEKGSEWNTVRKFIEEDIEIISKTSEEKRVERCSNLTKSYLKDVVYLNRRKH